MRGHDFQIDRAAASGTSHSMIKTIRLSSIPSYSSAKAETIVSLKLINSCFFDLQNIVGRGISMAARGARSGLNTGLNYFQIRLQHDLAEGH